MSSHQNRKMRSVRIYTNFIEVNPKWYDFIKAMKVYIYTINRSDENEVKKFLRGKRYVLVPDDKSNTTFIYSLDPLDIDMLNFYMEYAFSELIRDKESTARKLLTQYLNRKFSKELITLAKEIKKEYFSDVCDSLQKFNIQMDIMFSFRVQKLNNENCWISMYMKCDFNQKHWLCDLKRIDPQLYEKLIDWMKNGEIREFKFMDFKGNFKSEYISAVIDDPNKIKKILKETIQEGDLTIDKIKESVKRVSGREISENDIDVIIISKSGYKYVPHNVKLTLKFEVLKKIIGNLSLLSKIIKRRYKCLYLAIQRICKIAKDNGVQLFKSQRIVNCTNSVEAKFVYYDLDEDKIVIRRRPLRRLSLNELNVFIPIKAYERKINIIFVTPEDPHKLPVCTKLIELKKKIDISLKALDGKSIEKNPITENVPTKDDVPKLNIHPKPINLRRYKKNGKYEVKKLAKDIRSLFKSFENDGELNLVLVVIPSDLDYDLLKNELLRKGLYVQGIRIENAKKGC